MDIKSRLKKKYGDNAVTEIMGTLMLLAIAVGIFSVLYIFVFSLEVEDQPPSANIIGYVIDNTSYFEHRGGSPLDLSEIEIIFNVGDNTIIKDLVFNITNEMPDGNPGFLEIGEILYINNTKFNNSDVSVTFIDIITNSFLMQGEINRYDKNSPPYAPYSPDPGLGDPVGICRILSWSGGDPDGDIVTYDIYFGPDSMPINPSYTDNTTLTYNPGLLTIGITYHWKVVARDSHGVENSSLDWSFTPTIANNPPNTPSSPGPEDGELEVDINHDLNWTGGDPDSCDTVTYNVSFGESNPPIKVYDDNTTLTYDPGLLTNDTIYYWQIVAWDGTVEVSGPIWSFNSTTGPNNVPVISDPIPEGGAIGLNLSPILSVDVTDLDLELMNVTFYDASDDTPIGPTQTDVFNGSTVSITWSGLSYFTTYSWYVTAYDGIYNTTSATWSFTPGYFFDSFEENNMDIIWSDDGNNWDRLLSVLATNGTHLAEVNGKPPRINSSLTMANVIDLSGVTNAYLTYDWYITTNFEDNDYISLELYNGTSWKEWDNLNNTRDGDWFHGDIDLSLYLVSNFKIRFRAYIDKTDEYGYIDNIKIVGT